MEVKRKHRIPQATKHRSYNEDGARSLCGVDVLNFWGDGAKIGFASICQLSPDPKAAGDSSSTASTDYLSSGYISQSSSELSRGLAYFFLTQTVPSTISQHLID